ncbi:YMR261Cp-like protein, partial [Hanseniaspora valbyensis NRRL Y-1626]
NEIPKFGGYSNAEFLKKSLLGGQQNIFSKADWTIVPSHKCNNGLKNAINVAIFEKTFNQPVVFYGTLGLPTDVLPDQVLEDVTDKMRNEFNCESVISDDITFKGAYKNFCKEILWPTFHYQIPDNPKSKAFEDHSWNHYQLLNQRFADKIVEKYKEGDTVWVHDYHLLLVPGMVREKLPDAKIGFSLHISFPSSEVFRCFAQRDFILKGLLGANSLGFQTDEYAKHFALTCNRLMQTDGDIEEGIKFDGRTIQICCVPIGIDAFELEKTLRNSEELPILKNIIRDRWAHSENKKLIVSKDQFDTLRGLKTKFLAYEKFLRDNPCYISKVCFVQVVTGSTKKDKYLEKEIVSLVDKINNLSTDITMHQNIVLLTQELTELQYYALLSEADIFWVNSMREGMNLACHDFIVSTSDKNSPLMISEFTGSAELFKEGCLLTNPWDIKRLSEIIKFALEMTPEEKRRRWKKMMKKLIINDSDNWIISTVKSINSSWELNLQRSTLFNLNVHEWQEAYTNSNGKNKLFIFKISEPPTPDILKMLNDLCSVPGNEVFVLNTFDKLIVERYYARVNNLNLIAENGAFVRIHGFWYTLMGDNLWKNEVLPLLQAKLERLPGSYIKVGESMFRIHTENAEDEDRVNDIVGDLILHINTLFGSKKGIHAYFHKSILFVQQFGLSLKALKFIFDYYASSGSSHLHRNSSFNLSANESMSGSVNMSRVNSGNSPSLQPVIDNLKGVNKFSFAMVSGSSSPTIEPLFEYVNRFTGVNIAYTYTCVYGDPSSTNAQQHVNGMNDLIKLI